jgi:hypothetical protein
MKNQVEDYQNEERHTHDPAENIFPMSDAPAKSIGSKSNPNDSKHR